MRRFVIAFSVALLLLPFPLSLSEKTSVDYIGEIMNAIDENMISEYIQTLQNFGPRVTGSTACWEAGNYIYNEFISYGYSTHFINWSYAGYEDRNVEAILQGESNASIIICAHYDSVPGSPGADDNGSGTAAVLAAAKAIASYREKLHLAYTIRFITFSGEEQGLLGSYYYAEQARNNGMAIAAVINADMIGYVRDDIGKNKVKIYDVERSKWIADVAREISSNYSLNLSIYERNAGASSDHWFFIENGYDAVFFHEYQFNDYYHSSNDTIDKMDLEYATRVTRLIVGTLLRIAEGEITDEEPPYVAIEKPGNFLYIMDKEIMATKETIIIGKITLVFDAMDGLSGIAGIMVYVDDEKKAEIKTKPYEWVWDEPAFFTHEIKVVARDNAGNEAEASKEVTIFNI